MSMEEATVEGMAVVTAEVTVEGTALDHQQLQSHFLRSDKPIPLSLQGTVNY